MNREVVSICAIGLVSGAACTLFLKRMTDAEQIRLALNSIAACLFEFRLFADQPLVLLKAQRRLLAANARMLLLLAVPSLFLILPYWGMFVVIEGMFGRLPLKIGDSTVVTAQCRNAAAAFSNIWLQGSPELAVETPPVRIGREAQISWRVRALKPASGQLRLHVGSRTIVKNISAASGFQLLSEERGGSFWSFVAHPLEAPFLDSAIESIRVLYPVELNWLLWFGLASFAGASLPLFL